MPNKSEKENKLPPTSIIDAVREVLAFCASSWNNVERIFKLLTWLAAVAALYTFYVKTGSQKMLWGTIVFGGLWAVATLGVIYKVMGKVMDHVFMHFIAPSWPFVITSRLKEDNWFDKVLHKFPSLVQGIIALGILVLFPLLIIGFILLVIVPFVSSLFLAALQSGDLDCEIMRQ
jgi:hypothetical protein